MCAIKPTNTPKYINATGLMLVPNSPSSFLKSVADGDMDSNVAFAHEMAHHLHMMSVGYLYLSGNNLLIAAGKLIGRPESHNVNFYAAEFARGRKAFRHRAFGVSAQDLCEGIAVLESYRSLWSDGDVDHFLKFRDHYFPGKGNSIYRRTFDILAESIGSKNAYKMLSIISFLALQGDIPGRSFELLLREPLVSRLSSKCDSATEAISKLGYKRILTNLDYARSDALHPNQRHPIFYPILKDLTNRVTLTELLDVFVFPHKHKNLHTELQNRLYPPVILGAYQLQPGSALEITYGLACEDENLRDSITLFTSFVFAADRITRTADRPLECPHNNCPDYNVGICAGWLTIPSDPGKCGFRYYVQESSKKTPSEVYNFLSSTLDYDKINEIVNSKSTNILFPFAERMGNLDELDTHAERFDAKYLLDEDDNDHVVVIHCKSCGNLFNDRASRRKFEQGFIVTCPNCGWEKGMNTDDFAVISFD